MILGKRTDQRFAHIIFTKETRRTSNQKQASRYRQKQHRTRRLLYDNMDYNRITMFTERDAPTSSKICKTLGGGGNFIDLGHCGRNVINGDV